MSSMSIAVLIVFVTLAVFVMFVVFIAPMPPVFSMVMGNINVVVPPVLDEIDGPVAGIIPVTVLGPFFRMSGRHMEIEWFMNNVDGRWADHDGIGVNQLGPGGVAYVNLSVKSGLADAHRYINVGGCRLRRHGYKHN